MRTRTHIARLHKHLKLNQKNYVITNKSGSEAGTLSGAAYAGSRIPLEGVVQRSSNMALFGGGHRLQIAPILVHSFVCVYVYVLVCVSGGYH